METTNLGKSIKEIFDGQYKYIVPLYQRNFAWRQEQIEQLLQDVYEAFKEYKEKKTGNYFIGSLVVLKRPNGDFEVIDGQQRLTTLSLVTKIMGINDEPRLYYDSRPEVEEFFQIFYKSEDAECNIDYPQTYYLKNAIEYIKEANLDAKCDIEYPQTFHLKDYLKKAESDAKENNKLKDEFKTFFTNNVILVLVEIPQDTDVASYFEIMNNRGEQLQKHEILKSLMMSKLTDANQRTRFARIWDACSQMDIPIQKSFKAGNKDEVGTRNYYFSDTYDGFEFDNIEKIFATSSETNPQKGNNETSNGDTIDEIIDGKKTVPGNDGNTSGIDFTDEENCESESRYKSIIDYPNFLMHVFKSMFPNKEIPLNEKFLLSTYKEVEKDVNEEFSKKFISKLFFFRTVFDRYVVKTTDDDKDVEDGEKWALIKPKKYDKSWKYIGTFKDDDDNDKDNNQQKRIIKALSMLQVSYRTRIYKNWLYDILKWFDEKKKIDVSYEEYVKKLDEIILKEYDEKYNLNYKPLDDMVPLTKDNSYSAGTNTPHFLFNFIDYLYWVDSKNDNSIFENKKELKDFEFKYWNSVEHHMAREWADRNKIDGKDDFIDNLGNLCLISKNANSRLSDRHVQEKVETFGKGNLGANRQIMYNETKNPDGTYDWNKEKIKKHYNELLLLLSKSEEILKHN